MCTEQLIDIFKGLLTPIIALIAIYIAFQQLQTNRHKLKFEIYEKRLHVYKEVTKFLRTMMARPTKDDLLKFPESVAEASFMFENDPKILEFINNIQDEGVEIWNLNEQYPKFPHAIPKELAEKMVEKIKWFRDQSKEAEIRFRKYLIIGR
jgi:hypothetical protein